LSPKFFRIVPIFLLSTILISCNSRQFSEPAVEPDRVQQTAVSDQLFQTEVQVPEKVSIEWLQEFLEENNPELKRIRSEINALQGRSKEEGLYPNPTLGVYQRNETINDHSPISETTEVVISQPFVINDRLSIAEKAESQRVEAAKHRYEQRRQVLQKEMRDLHDKVLFHKEHESVAWELLAYVEEEIKSAKTENDRERLQIIWEELSLEITVIAAELAFAMQNLETYLGLPLELNSSQFTMELATSLNYEYQRALTEDLILSTPEYLMSRSELQARETDHELSKATVTPDVSVQAGGGYRYAYDESFFSLGLQVPLPIFDRNQGKKIETKSLIEAQEAEIDRVQINQLIEIKNLKQYANEISTTYDVYAYEIVPRSRATYNKVSEEYANDESTIHDILSALRTLIQNERLLVEYKRDVNAINAHSARLLGLPEPSSELN